MKIYKTADADEYKSTDRFGHGLKTRRQHDDSKALFVKQCRDGDVYYWGRS